MLLKKISPEFRIQPQFIFFAEAVPEPAPEAPGGENITVQDVLNATYRQNGNIDWKLLKDIAPTQAESILKGKTDKDDARKHILTSEELAKLKTNNEIYLQTLEEKEKRKKRHAPVRRETSKELSKLKAETVQGWAQGKAEIDQSDEFHGVRRAAEARDRHREEDPELAKANAEAIVQKMNEAAKDAMSHALSASTKFREYDQEARKVTLDRHNISEHGWLRIGTDKGLLGIFFNGNEEQVLEQQMQYWYTGVADNPGAEQVAKESARLLGGTVIASGAATATENLARLAINGALPENIPVTILFKLGEMDLGIRGRDLESLDETEMQFMVQYRAAYENLMRTAPELKDVLKNLKKNPRDPNAQAKLQEISTKLEVQEAYKKFEELANFADFSRLTALKKGIEESFLRHEQNVPRSMDLARHMKPSDRKIYLEYVRRLQNLQKNPVRNKEERERINNVLDTFLRGILGDTNAELSHVGTPQIDTTLITEHLFRSTEAGQKLLDSLPEAYLRLGTHAEGLTESDKAIIQIMLERTHEQQAAVRATEEELKKSRTEGEVWKKSMEGHMDQKLGPRVSLILFGLTKSSKYAWGTLGKKKGLEDVIQEGKKRYDISEEKLEQEKKEWLKDNEKVRDSFEGGTLHYDTVREWSGRDHIGAVMEFLKKMWGENQVESMIKIYNGTARDRKVNEDHVAFVEGAVDSLFPIFREIGITDLNNYILTTDQKTTFEARKGRIDAALQTLLNLRIQEKVDKGGKKRREYAHFTNLERQYQRLQEISAQGTNTTQYQEALDNFVRALELTMEAKLSPNQREMLNAIAEQAAYINEVGTKIEGSNPEILRNNRSIHPKSAEILPQMQELVQRGKELHQKFLQETVLKAFDPDANSEQIASEFSSYNKQFEALRVKLVGLAQQLEDLNKDPEDIKKAQDLLVEENAPAFERIINEMMKKKAPGRYIPVGRETFKSEAQANDFYILLTKADLSDWQKFEKSLGPDVEKALREHRTPATTGRFNMLPPDEMIDEHYGSNLNMLQLLLPKEGKRPPILETWQSVFSEVGLIIPNSEIMEAVSKGKALTTAEVQGKYGNSQNTGVFYFPEADSKNASFLPAPGEFVYEITFDRTIITGNEKITVTFNVLLRDKCFNVNIPNLNQITRSIEKIPTPEIPPAVSPPIPVFESTPFVQAAQKLMPLIAGYRFELPPSRIPKIATEGSGGSVTPTDRP